MEPRIEVLTEKKLVGIQLTMSLASNKTGELWRSFMPRRKEIQHALRSELISMQVYKQPLVFGDLTQEFEKWAVVEVSDFATIPAGMEPFTLPGGLWAVFDYKGSSTDTHIFGNYQATPSRPPPRPEGTRGEEQFVPSLYWGRARVG